jgi:hypothetical protein
LDVFPYTWDDPPLCRARAVLSLRQLTPRRHVNKATPRPGAEVEFSADDSHDGSSGNSGFVKVFHSNGRGDRIAPHAMQSNRHVGRCHVRLAAQLLHGIIAPSVCTASSMVGPIMTASHHLPQTNSHRRANSGHPLMLQWRTIRLSLHKHGLPNSR